MVLGKIKMPEILYNKSSLDQRRAFFLKKNNMWKKLEKLILSKKPGSLLIYTPKPVNPMLLLHNGQFIDKSLVDVFNEVTPSKCHNLSHALWKRFGWEIWTGYALSDDDKWREHSWVKSPKGFLETTGISRIMYFGMKLTDQQLNSIK